MNFHPSRAIFLALLILASWTVGAKAGPIDCPTTLKLSNNTAHASFGANVRSTEATIVGSDLVCRYSAQFQWGWDPKALPSVRCSGVPSFTATTVGGTGQWNFGAPGTDATWTFPGLLAMCRTSTGSPGGEVTLAVWQVEPTGEPCTANANGQGFNCVAPPPICPSPITGSQIPTTVWSASSSQPGYWAEQSAIVNAGNGIPVVSSAPLSTIKSYMGSSFAGAKFALPSGGQGSGGGLPPGYVSCQYNGPVFSHNGQKLFAIPSIACKGMCTL